jgi:hypothetical protein
MRRHHVADASTDADWPRRLHGIEEEHRGSLEDHEVNGLVDLGDELLECRPGDRADVDGGERREPHLEQSRPRGVDLRRRILLGEVIDRFYRGSTGDARDRIKLFKLIWDAVGTEFGSRHEWYEINYSGNHEQMRLDMARFSGGRGIIEDCEALVDQCLDDYDLDGWTNATWAG